MCLIVFEWQPDRPQLLTVAANRDEFYQRDTLSAHYWEDHPHIFGGRDMELGGTWLGVSQSQRFAAVTNFRELIEQKSPLSRGAIPANFLKGSHSASDFCKALAPSQSDYAGFNAILFDGSCLWYCSNRHENFAFELEPGIYGLSNHLLDSPWPKVESTKSSFKNAMANNEGKNESLLKTLGQQLAVEDKDLPNTGVGIERERFLSTAFIKSAVYGTRASTIVKITNGEHIEFVEQNFGINGLEGELRTKYIPVKN